MGICTTEEDLLQYLYHETSPEKSASIEAALESDWSLNEQFKAMVATQKQLAITGLSPRKVILEKIKNYADDAISQLHPQ